MKEHYVSFECADKLKDLGFDWECNRYYTDGYANHDPEDLTKVVKLHYDSPRNHNRVISADGACYSAPRLDQAQAWLREVKEIDVLVFNCACGYGWEISKANTESRGTGIAIFDDEGEDKDSGMWLSYEKALSAGIDKALELLTNKS